MTNRRLCRQMWGDQFIPEECPKNLLLTNEHYDKSTEVVSQHYHSHTKLSNLC